jgi:predicted RNA-binding protein with EMAP domain
MELESTRMELSEDDTTDPSDSEDSNMGIRETHWPSNPSEIKSRLHAYIAHEQEHLIELLNELESEVQTSLENILVEKIKRCFKCIDDITEYATQFLKQARLIEIRDFTGFHYKIENDAKQATRQALTVLSTLRRGNLPRLASSVKELVKELDDIRILVSKKTLEQVKETLQENGTRRAYTLRQIERLFP